ncbi:hypothetical protein NLJ89_g299 [Agrocybe chaxingu]|uniref:RanBP2-type domain-containing protein n=1 Tax=Agrocybe chaxingu TaxID=84603 RepID=A0A9W8TF36_9AGAR|nr:hypothetical protein NLJ89_g299 [Agrocybe chaxingu]
MSVIRTSTNRADARKKRSAPYGRSVVSTVLRFFGFGGGDDGGRASQSEGDSSASDASTTALSSGSPRRYGDYTPQQQQFPQSSRPPLTPARLAPEPTGFRFTFTTPSRDPSPSASQRNGISLNSPTPSRKRLAKNPNGVYRWEGAGSAKRATPRNRYASPAFGASPSRRDPLKTKDNTSSPNTATTDNKRRKVDVPSAGSSSSGSSKLASTVPFPVTASPTPPRTNGTNSRPNGAPSAPSLLRTPAKPNAPVIPSPLRQTWSQASSISSKDESRKSPSQPPKQSDTANFMAELIKETTPVKKPDISNPYQSSHSTGKVIQPRPKKPRAARKQEEDKKKAEEEKQKEKEKEKLNLKDYSPQAIIEATLPAGSKRSRPPAHFEKSPSTSGESSASTPPIREAPVIVETKKVTYVVEEADDEEGAKRSSKRSKPSIDGRGLPSTLPKRADKAPADSDITVEEVDDIVMDAQDKGKGKEKERARPVEAPKPTPSAFATPPAVNGSSAASRAPFLGFKSTSAPKEPSKLRNSIVAEGSSAPSTPAPAPPLKPAPSPPSFQTLASSNSGFSFKPPTPAAPAEAKQDRAPSVDSIKSQHEFTFATKGFSFDYDTSKPKPYSPPSFSKPSPPPKSNPNPFLSSSTTTSPAGAALFGSTMFGTKTTIPASAPTPAPGPAPVQGFNWAAAGMKAPEIVKDQWKCGVCCIMNTSAAAKCIACDEPAPKSTSSPRPPAALPSPTPLAPPVAGFNWGAAGLKTPEVPKNKWSCSACGLSNPLTASKCEICDAPK